MNLVIYCTILMYLRCQIFSFDRNMASSYPMFAFIPVSGHCRSCTENPNDKGTLLVPNCIILNWNYVICYIEYLCCRAAMMEGSGTLENQLEATKVCTRAVERLIFLIALIARLIILIAR